MKALYIVFHGLNKSSGISKKIIAQVKALNNIGISTSLCYFGMDRYNKCNSRWIDDLLLEKYETSFGIKKNWKWRYRFKSLYEHIKNSEIDLIYIRYTHFANPFFIQFLKKVKKLNVTIALEIPTFPYDNEYINVGFLQRIIIHIEKTYRKFFKKNIDTIITFSNAKNIFGVSTIKINNGIDLAEIKIKQNRSQDLGINLIAVASMLFWHGYDRLIEGLKNYNKKNNQTIHLHLVGNSNNEESKNYKYLVEKYKLDNYVTFHGYKDGTELDELYNISDIAIGCLGVHRKGIKHIKSLKNSEYCARGIPFVYSENDDSFDDKPFVFKIPANDEPIELEEIINFFKSNNFIPEEIREYALKKLSWDIQMNKVIQLIS
jgi:glycosyltransferase involved in cell wall biosynthesis